MALSTKVADAAYKQALREAEKITKKASEMLVLLHSAPQCISLLGDMVALSVQSKVELKKHPGGGKHFKEKMDLQTGLITIANSGLDAFGKSQTNMKKVSGFVSEVPGSVQEITQILTEGEPDDFVDVPDMSAKIVMSAKGATAYAQEVYQMFEALTEQVNELMVIITHTRSDVQGKIDDVKIHNKAEEYVDDLVKLRRKNLEKDLKENCDNKDKAAQEQADVTEQTWNDNDVVAGYDRTLLLDFANRTLDLFKPDGSGDVDKIKGEEGAKYWAAVVEGVREMFVSIRTTTIRDLFDEAHKVLEAIAADDFKHDIKPAQELKKKAEEWKYNELPADQLVKKEDPPRPKELTLQYTAFHQAFNFLLDGFKILNDFRNTWRNLVVFFGDLSILLETVLTTSVTTFSTKAEVFLKNAKQSDAMKGLIVNQAVIVCRAAFQVKVASVSYEKIYAEYLAPNLSLVGLLLGIKDVDKVGEKKDEVYRSCLKATEGVKRLTEEIAAKTTGDYQSFVKVICGKE